MPKSCFTSLLVLVHFYLLFVYFFTISGSNDLFPMEKINWPIRANLTPIGWKSDILNYNLVFSFKIHLFFINSVIWLAFVYSFILHIQQIRSWYEKNCLIGWWKFTLENLRGPHTMSKIYSSYPYRSFASLYWACTIPVRPFPLRVWPTIPPSLSGKK